MISIILKKVMLKKAGGRQILVTTNRMGAESRQAMWEMGMEVGDTGWCPQYGGRHNTALGLHRLAVIDREDWDRYKVRRATVDHGGSLGTRMVHVLEKGLGLDAGPRDIIICMCI